MSKKFSKYLWIERYRPQTVKDTLLPTGMKNFFTTILKEKEFPNLLFYSSSPGVGKTTVAKALCREAGMDYKYINTSSESGIDTLRTTIQKFASAKSLIGGNKVVILDEFDFASPNLQAGLRAAMEEFHQSCRFILTANYITKIIEPLKSRCQIIDFNMTEKKICKEMEPKITKRLSNILKHEKIEFKLETIEKLVNTYYPDIRKMIGLLQQYSKTYGLIDSNIFDYERIDDEFYEYLLTGKLTKAREYLIQKNYNYQELFRNLFDNFIPKLPKEKKAEGILLISEYMHRHAFAIDPEINGTALLLELIGIIK